jgi:hypothetical protein
MVSFALADLPHQRLAIVIHILTRAMLQDKETPDGYDLSLCLPQTQICSSSK